MDPLFEILDTVRVPPGTSPFHVRGLLYEQILKHAGAMPGGVPGLLAQIEDEQIRTFMKQRFRWTEWYDALPMTPVQAALCRMQKGEFETLTRQRARLAAESLVPRLFRVVLGMGNPKAAAGHLPRLLAQNYDFSDVSLQVGQGEGTALFRKVPRAIAPSFVNVVVGLIEGALGLMGAKNVQTKIQSARLDAPLHGFETITCEGASRWDM